MTASIICLDWPGSFCLGKHGSNEQHTENIIGPVTCNYELLVVTVFSKIPDTSCMKHFFVSFVTQNVWQWVPTCKETVDPWVAHLSVILSFFRQLFVKSITIIEEIWFQIELERPVIWNIHVIVRIMITRVHIHGDFLETDSCSLPFAHRIDVTLYHYHNTVHIQLSI